MKNVCALFCTSEKTQSQLSISTVLCIQYKDWASVQSWSWDSSWKTKLNWVSESWHQGHTPQSVCTEALRRVKHVRGTNVYN